MPGKPDCKLALCAPEGNAVPLSDQLINEAIAGSRISPRKRIILPLHKNGSSLLQRMLNAIQPGSYIRPHRHADDRPESILVLKGAIAFVVFSELGEIIQTEELRADSEVSGIDMEGGVWHSFFALEPDTVLFEVKPGPYNPETDKEFALWAPEEFTAEAGEYLRGLIG